MSWDRFFELRTNLHLVNNLEIPSENKDKFFKVRPIYTEIRNVAMNFLLKKMFVLMKQLIIPFTENFSAKRYIKGKPK
jgi:hypothetical protein